MKNEPVAWMVESTPETKGYGDNPYVTLLDATKSAYWIENKIPEGYTIIPLYTHPVKELTDEEILDIWYAMKDDSNNWTRYVDFARAILRKAQE